MPLDTAYYCAQGVTGYYHYVIRLLKIIQNVEFPQIYLDRFLAHGTNSQSSLEKLPECVYLATSDDLSGLIAQGRTITETLEIARDIAKKLIEAQNKTTPQPT